jgi:hypothetical protein
MTDTHDLFLLRKSVVDPCIDLRRIIDLDEHLHHVGIRSAVKRSGECGDAGSHAAVHIGKRSGDNTCRES